MPGSTGQHRNETVAGTQRMHAAPTVHLSATLTGWTAYGGRSWRFVGETLG